MKPHFLFAFPVLPKIYKKSILVVCDTGQSISFAGPFFLSMQPEFVSQVENLIDTIVKEEGLELWLVQWVNEHGRNILRVMVEKSGGRTSLDDCTRVSHAIEDLLEVKDMIPSRYDLEVSSPGLDRPLGKKQHFDSVIGETIRVKTARPLNERRNYKGVLKQTTDESFVMEIDGREYVIPYSEVLKANVEF